MSIELVMPSNHLVLYCPLLFLPSIFPSIRIFSNELAFHIRWPNFWRFSFSISPSNEHSRLISFRIDWFDLLAVQVTLKSLLQHHGWKALILHSGFFIVQLSHPHMTTEKNINLTIQTFVTKVMSLLFNTLSRFVIYRCESWTIKKAECRRIDTFELWSWRRLLRVSWTARRSSQSILKEINSEYSLEAKAEAPILWSSDSKSQLIRKDPDAGKD